MGFLKRLFRRSQPEPNAPEHAVIVRFQLSGDGFGTQDERAAVHELADRLESRISSAGVGEFDGDEFGNGQCTLYMYGPDANALFQAVEPALRASPLSRGGSVIKRFGEASDANAREETLML